MAAPKLPTRILGFLKKNKWWTLLVTFLGGIILLQNAVDSGLKLWDTRKLFTQAKQDTDAIAELRTQIQKQKDALDLVVRDSNAAYKEIAAIRMVATEAKDQISVLGSLVKEAKTELQVLEKRNELTSLADDAISLGSVEAYKKLETLAGGNATPAHGPEMAELFRVYNAYTGFAPSRVLTVTLVPEKIDPQKHKEDQLTTDELLPLMMTSKEFLVRGRCAMLISNTGKPGSYKLAEALVDAIKRESHLEVHRYLREAFKHVVPDAEAGGLLDNSGIIKWWDNNREKVREKDSDAPAAVTK